MLNRFKTQLQKHLNTDNQSTSQSTNESSASLYIATLKDSALLIEYSRLVNQSPPGIYVIPSINSANSGKSSVNSGKSSVNSGNNSSSSNSANSGNQSVNSANFHFWHGVIFLRKGFYRTGIFKFTLDLSSYPGNPPVVKFIGQIPYHPLVDSSTGEIDLLSINAFQQWRPDAHSIVHVLAYIKKIFYKPQWFESINQSVKESSESNQSINQNDGILNSAASLLYQRDRDEFLARVEKCCQASNDVIDQSINQSTNQSNNQVGIKFSRPIPAHEEVWKRISNTASTPLNPSSPRSTNQSINQSINQSYLSWFEPGANAIHDLTRTSKTTKVTVTDAELAAWKAHDQSINQSTNQSISQSINQSTKQSNRSSSPSSVNQSNSINQQRSASNTTQLANSQLINESISQSINQSNDQSNDESNDFSLDANAEVDDLP